MWITPPFDKSSGIQVKSASASVILTVAGSATGQHHASASASVIFTASLSSSGVHTESASASVILIAAGSATGLHHASASALVILSPVAKSIQPSAALVVLTASGSSVAMRVKSASAPVVLSASASVFFPPAGLGEDFLGRFQVGQEVPLYAIVVDQNGQPEASTTVTPSARIYNLETLVRVEQLDLHRVRRSRAASFYGISVRIGRAYTPARYGVHVRMATGGFSGIRLMTFEVVPGGDAAGPVIAAVTSSNVGDRVLTHLGEGSLALASGPRVS